MSAINMINPIIHTEFEKFAHLLADISVDVSAKYFRKAGNIDSKQDKSPVTIADREIESRICEKIRKVYPDHAIYGEEFGEVSNKSSFKWVIDPIDGTMSFISGRPLFTTLIALLENNSPILGMICQPISNERWLATIGAPIKKKTSDVKLIEDAITATTSPFLFSADKLAIYNKFKDASKYNLYGGDAYNYAQLADGNIDIVIESGLKPYDFLALVPIIKASGGIITDWQGSELDFNSSGDVLACANQELHRQAIKMIYNN